MSWELKLKKIKIKLTDQQLLFLSAVSFVFVASCAFVITKPDNYQTKNRYLSESYSLKSLVVVSPLPVLTKAESFPILSAQGVIATDLDSGFVLYEKNADEPLLPASTTKIMTALVVLDYYPVDKVLRVGREVVVEGQKMHLVIGEDIMVENLMRGLLMFSANDAAEVLAVNYPGGREAFIEAMNAKAEKLSMKNTNFVNPTGLDGSGHFSTARDLVRLAKVAMKNSWFSEVVAAKKSTVASVDGKIVHYLKNINRLLGEVEGVLGIKTGWTEEARENLVTYVERDGRKVLIAVLGSQDRFGETKELIDWIFDNYKWQEINYSSTP